MGFGDISRMNLADLEKKTNEMETIDEEIVQQNESGESEKKFSEQEDETAEMIEEPQKMAEPVGRHYYIDAEITGKEMTSFLMGHNYRQPLVISATILAILTPLLAVVKGQSNLVYIVAIAIVVILYFPLSALNKGKNAKKLNPLYEEIFHYMLDETGLHLELGEEAVDVEWKRVLKIMSLKSVVAVYTGRANAFLIPTKDMGEEKDNIIAFMKEMKKKR